jgi:hypothetical protein
MVILIYPVLDGPLGNSQEMPHASSGPVSVLLSGQQSHSPQFILLWHPYQLHFIIFSELDWELMVISDQFRIGLIVVKCFDHSLSGRLQMFLFSATHALVA